MSNNDHCYLCNCAFVDNKVYEQMFEKRFNVTGSESDTLASILETVLTMKLHEHEVHSTFVCSTCKVSLLNYEAMAQQLLQLRLEITEMHRQTIELLQNQSINMCNTIPPIGSTQLSVELLEARELEHYAEEATDLMDNCYEDTDSKVIIEPCSGDEELELLELESAAVDRTEDCTDSSEEHKDVMQIKDILLNNLKRGRPSKRSGQPKRKYKCKYCEKICNRLDSLIEHERVHTGERPFECGECGAKFAQRSNRLCHMRTTHLNMANFKCGECGRTFKRRRLLQNHIKSVHRKLRDLRCDQCGATFGNAINLKKHLLCHTSEKKFSCEICGKQFRCAENRNVHHFVHSIRKPYVCVICNEGFMRKQQLIQHSKVQNHHNPKIVRLKPQFSAANSDKLLQRLLPPAATSN